MSEKKMRKGERTLQESWREGDGEKEGSLGYPLQGERRKEKEGTNRTESERTGCSSLPRLPAKNLVMALFSNARGHRGHAHQPGITFSTKP